jgi:hypothetical protein
VGEGFLYVYYYGKYIMISNIGLCICVKMSFICNACLLNVKAFKCV